MSQVTGVVANRKTLIWIMLLGAAPFLLATVLYMVWKPSRMNTVGVFLDPQGALSAPGLLDRSGASAPLQQLQGKWLLLTATESACDARCKDALFRMRQVRTAQGEYMNRVERVWLGADLASSRIAAAEAEADGVLVRTDGQGTIVDLLPRGKAGLVGAIYLIDPNGNLVMRYDPSVEPVKMIREINRIIKINNGLG